MRARRLKTVLALSLLLAFAQTAFAQATQRQPDGDEHDLAKKLSNPVSSLISLPFQSNFDFGMGTGSGWRYTLNTQPVIPISLNSKWNLISRTIVPFIHQHNVSGTTTQNGLGDISQSFFFSPTDSKRFIWGVGSQYNVNTESSYDWTANHWNAPIHFTVSKLVRFGKQPVSLGGGVRCWATSLSGGPEGCGLRIIVTPLFPKK